MEGPSWLWLVVFVLLIVRFVHKSLCPFETWSDRRTVAPDFNLA
jgi:hypothetical protein